MFHKFQKRYYKIMNQDYNQLKHQAAEFYYENQVPERLEEILNSMFFENPKDVYGRLSEHFEKFATTPVISKFTAHEVLDSGGASAVQCEIFAVIKNHVKKLALAQVCLRKEASHLNQAQVEEAPSISEIAEACCTKITESISSKLHGIPVISQLLIDKALSDWADDTERAMFRETSSAAEANSKAASRTPTPSSGRKKKAPSGKAKPGKVPDKPVPPKEPLEPRMKGCTSISAASLAALKAGSQLLCLPVFAHLRNAMNQGDETPKGEQQVLLPCPAMTVYSGGKQAIGKMKLIKSLSIVAKPGWSMKESSQKLGRVFQQFLKNLSAKSSSGPLSALSGGFQLAYDKVEQPLDAVADAVNASGLTVGQDIFFALELEAHEIFDYDKGKYEIIAGTFKNADEMCDLYKDLQVRYPAIALLINPLRKEDREQWPKICESISEKCFVVGGESVTGPLHSLNSHMLESRRSSGVAIGNEGRVTCSDLARIAGDVKAGGGVTVLCATPGDVSEDCYSDLAVGLGVNIVILGPQTRGENTSRWNRLLEIELQLKDNEKFRAAYHEKFIFPLIKAPPPPTPKSDDEADAHAATPEQKAKKK